jgi:hypothetical protein
MAQLVDALSYKPESRGFNTIWDLWDFLLAYSFRLHYGPDVYSAANMNDYEGYPLGGKRRMVCRADNLTTFMHIFGSPSLVDLSRTVVG